MLFWLLLFHLMTSKISVITQKMWVKVGLTVFIAPASDLSLTHFAALPIKIDKNQGKIKFFCGNRRHFLRFNFVSS